MLDAFVTPGAAGDRPSRDACLALVRRLLARADFWGQDLTARCPASTPPSPSTSPTSAPTASAPPSNASPEIRSPAAPARLRRHGDRRRRAAVVGRVAGLGDERVGSGWRRSGPPRAGVGRRRVGAGQRAVDGELDLGDAGGIRGGGGDGDRRAHFHAGAVRGRGDRHGGRGDVPDRQGPRGRRGGVAARSYAIAFSDGFRPAS